MKKIASRSAQYVLASEFTFNFDDTMVNTAGTLDNFSAVGAHVYDIIPLPPNSTILTGNVSTNTAFTGSTAYNVKIGDSLDDDRYLASADRTAVGASGLNAAGFINTTGENLRMTVTPTVAAATAGKITVLILYTVVGRANEVQIT